MRILMLGWEFPPFISGGLGTACYGLTKALDKRGHEITFVLPKAVDRSHASHVRVQSPESVAPNSMARAARLLERAESGEPIDFDDAERLVSWKPREFAHLTVQPVPAGFSSPYGAGGPVAPEEQGEQDEAGAGSTTRADQPQSAVETETETCAAAGAASPSAAPGLEYVGSLADRPTPGFLGLSHAAGTDYGGDLLGDTRRYAELCVALNRDRQYDVIHAHDWLTFPAGMAIARMMGIPLIVHIHSTEFDRSGQNVNQQVYDIERRGMHSAMRVNTVSHWTRNIVIHRYGVDPAKIRVIWNGIDQDRTPIQRPPITSQDKIVLFLGRITMQKGPEYFISAAKRVLEKIENVKFIVAGSGDMAVRMIELAAEMGIGHKVLFTGFLRGADVDRVFKMADCYVMPSVSEPFGIAPLEAMSNDVPVIISKQSGVSEVLTHALKVDFWDVDEMANKIIAVLRHPPLGQTLRHQGAMELRRITWDGAAEKCEGVYREAMEGMTAMST